MTVKEMATRLGLVVLSGHAGLNREISGGYSSDLLSDVMGNCEAGRVWITLQTHKNVMAIASLKDLSAVILIKDFKPEADMAVHSEEEEIPVLGTSLPAFEIAGQLFELLK